MLRDYQEIQKYPLPTVSAAPLESNIYEWHANIMAVADTIYTGMIFHFIMKFPKDYPHSPPKISMENTIIHPNIFGSKDYFQNKKDTYFSSSFGSFIGIPQ